MGAPHRGGRLQRWRRVAAAGAVVVALAVVPAIPGAAGDIQTDARSTPVLAAGGLSAPTAGPMAASAPGSAPRTLPADSGTLAGVVCPWQPVCLAIGSGSGRSRAEAWNGYGWYPITLPGSGPLTGVSCGSHSSCLAVGYANGTTEADVWRGSGWAAVAPLDAAGATSSWLNAVSCTSAYFCMAVGLFTANTYRTTRPMAEIWDGRRWSPAPPAVSPLWNFADLQGVSCTSPRWCMAVGSSRAANYRVVALAERWDGRRWTAVRTSYPGTAVTDELTAVSCSVSTNCEAVGNYGTASDTFVPLTEAWNGHGWAALRAGDPAGATFAQLAAVSCAGPYACAAAGYSVDSELRTTALTELWNGRHWEIRPTVGGGIPGALAGVGCIRGNDCMAVGQNGGPYLEESWDGAAWRRAFPSPVVAIAATLDGTGYYLAGRGGEVYPAGNARWYGDLRNHGLSAPIVSIAVDPDTGGYWLVGRDGAVYAFNAPYYGSPALSTFGTTAVGIIAVTGGGGYRVASADGGVFDFGPRARFEGSMTFTPLRKPIVAIAADPATGGYWLIAADGGVFSFHAPFYGSTGALTLRQPIVGAEATPTGNGYRFVASDGGVFSFGGARFAGSLGSRGSGAPVVGITTLGAQAGYYVAEASGAVARFGGVPALAVSVVP